MLGDRALLSPVLSCEACVSYIVQHGTVHKMPLLLDTQLLRTKNNSAVSVLLWYGALLGDSDQGQDKGGWQGVGEL